MKIKILAGCVAIFMIALAGCKTQKAMTTLSQLEGEWNLIELNGEAVTSEQYKQFIVFDITQNLYSGSAGCNRMSGGFNYNESEPNKIKFARPMTTRMACPILESEQEFISALEEVARFEVVPSKDTTTLIALYNADNTKTIIFRKK